MINLSLLPIILRHLCTATLRLRVQKPGILVTETCRTLFTQCGLRFYHKHNEDVCEKSTTIAKGDEKLFWTSGLISTLEGEG